MRSGKLQEMGYFVVSSLLGGLGIFLLQLSFEDHEFGGYALILLVAATGLVLAEEASDDEQPY